MRNLPGRGVFSHSHASIITAFFRHSENLRQEAAAIGAEVIEMVGLEGLAAWLPHLGERWSTPEGQETIMFAARSAEAEPALLGLSAHLVAVTCRT